MWRYSVLKMCFFLVSCKTLIIENCYGIYEYELIRIVGICFRFTTLRQGRASRIVLSWPCTCCLKASIVINFGYGILNTFFRRHIAEKIYNPTRAARSGQVEFVMDKVALGQVFSEYFGFPCQSWFHKLFHSRPHLSSGAGTIGQKWPQYKGLSPTPLAIKRIYNPTFSKGSASLKHEHCYGI
jgi:hypothetical protein